MARIFVQKSGTGTVSSGAVTVAFYDAAIVSNNVAIELNNGRKQKILLNQAAQVTIGNPTRGGSAPAPGDWISLYVLQDSTGGRPTPAWGSAFGSDVKNQVLDPTANTRSAYALSLHDDNLWHLDSFTTGLPVT